MDVFYDRDRSRLKQVSSISIITYLLVLVINLTAPHARLLVLSKINVMESWIQSLEKYFGFLPSHGYLLRHQFVDNVNFGNKLGVYEGQNSKIEILVDRGWLGVYFHPAGYSRKFGLELLFLVGFLKDRPEFVIRGGLDQKGNDLFSQMDFKGVLLKEYLGPICMLLQETPIAQLENEFQQFGDRVIAMNQ